MKKAFLCISLILTAFLCTSCSDNSNIDISSGKLKIGSIMISTSNVESAQQIEESEYLLTLVKNEAWLNITAASTSGTDDNTGANFADVMHDLWMNEHPERSLADGIASLSFGDIQIRSDAFYYNQESTYNVLCSFYYDGYAYILRYYANTINADTTRKFVVLLENSAFLTFGEIRTLNSQEEIAPKETERQNTSIFDNFYATDEQKKALWAVEQYLLLMPFSRQGLIEQLEFDGFSNVDAVYAVDHTMINWQDQAELSAKNYLEMMPFSANKLYEQLLFDGFTEDQSKYGVMHSGADFKEQAILCAKSYRRTISLTGQELYEQLLFEGFTEEQAKHGVQFSK